MRITSLRLYFRDYFIWLPFLLLTGMVLFLWWYTLSKIPATSEQVYLHYNIIFGIDQYGSRTMLYYPLGLSLGVFFVNIVGSFLLYHYDRVIARLILIVTLLFALFLLLAMTRIVGLNI